jgi:hypothetical protein
MLACRPSVAAPEDCRTPAMRRSPPYVHADVFGRNGGASVEATTVRCVMRARMGAGLAVTAILLPLGGYGLARAGAAPEGTPLVIGLLSIYRQRFPAAGAVRGESPVPALVVAPDGAHPDRRTVRRPAPDHQRPAPDDLLVRQHVPDPAGTRRRRGAPGDHDRKKPQEAAPSDREGRRGRRARCPRSSREPCGAGVSGPCSTARTRRPHDPRLPAAGTVLELVHGCCTTTRRAVALSLQGRRAR